MSFKNSNYTGCYAEQYFSAECLKRNIPVCFPVMDSSPYDCIIDKDGELLKIQIKSCTKTPSSESPNNIGVPLTNGVKIHYTFENVDYYAIWSEFYDGFFIFPNTGNMQGVRITLTGERKIWFNNYDFDKKLRYNQLSIFDN